MKRLANDLQVDDKVKFLGYIPNAGIYLKYFDLSLFTSDWEGMPITLWEAMASSLPIIAPNVGGMKEIIKKEDCGLIYSTCNIEECANLIVKLLADKKRREQMGNNGFLAVKEKYNSRVVSFLLKNFI